MKFWNIMRALFACFFILFLLTPARAATESAAPAASFSKHTITMKNGYVSTYYVYKKGRGDSDTFLFFISGSGCTSLKYYLKKYFEDLNGDITIYALQKRFVKDSAISLTECPKDFNEWNDFPRWVTDQQFFVNEILKETVHPPKNILIFGVSEGGNVAAAVATRILPATHLAIIGSGGMKQADELKLLNFGESKIDFDAEYQNITVDPYDVDKDFLGQKYKYWASVLFVDPIPYYSKLDIPILVAMGEDDQSVPIESGLYLKNSFAMLHKSNLTFISYPGCNHSLVDADGIDHKKDFFDKLVKWLAGEKVN